MCGIFGFAGFDQPGLLERMGEALVHRGPDSVGYLRKPQIQMGTRRLRIIDPEGGEQPMGNRDGSVALCINGEIYNYRELREELRERGHGFGTNSDTEVALRAYEEWGESFLERLNGMFGLALWDEAEGRLLLARDRCGQKPLYYWSDGRQLVFASEIKALLTCSIVPREASVRAIDSYLALRYTPGPETMFEGIRCVPPAHHLSWREPDGIGEPRRYWEVPNPVASEDAEEKLGTLLDDAVRLTLRSDVEVGAYLSGGVDSALLVESITRQRPGRLHTFSIGFGAPTDETALATASADLLGTRHHEIICSPDDVARLLPEVVWQMDRPVGDALTTAFHRLAGAAREEVGVVLSGEGADEALGGYSFHSAILRIEALRRRFGDKVAHRLLPAVLDAAPVGLLNRLNSFPGGLGRRGRARVSGFLRRYPGFDLEERERGLRTLFDRDERSALYLDGSRIVSGLLPPEADPPHGEFLDQLLALQWRDWLPDWALIRQDKNSMAHGLEVRLPYLDHRLIELAFQIPVHRKISGRRDKIALREFAASRLPRAIAHRGKVPFHLPVEQFLENPALRNLVVENLDPARIRSRGYFEPKAVAELVSRMHGRDFLAVKQVFALVILELWHRLFIDGESLV